MDFEEICFALNDELELDHESVEAFLRKYQDEKILIFGFTYMVWTKFYKSLREKNIRLTLQHARVIHGGGWKKMEKIPERLVLSRIPTRLKESPKTKIIIHACIDSKLFLSY